MSSGKLTSHAMAMKIMKLLVGFYSVSLCKSKILSTCKMNTKSTHFPFTEQLLIYNHGPSYCCYE